MESHHFHLLCNLQFFRAIYNVVQDVCHLVLLSQNTLKRNLLTELFLTQQVLRRNGKLFHAITRQCQTQENSLAVAKVKHTLDYKQVVLVDADNFAVIAVLRLSIFFTLLDVGVDAAVLATEIP